MKYNPLKHVEEIHREWTAAGVTASRPTVHSCMQDMFQLSVSQDTSDQETEASHLGVD